MCQFVELRAVEMRVCVESMAPWLAVVFAPGPHEGIGFGEHDAVLPPVDPLPCVEGLADVADVAKAGIGARCEVGYEPVPVRLPQQGAQDGGRLRGEYRAQAAALGLRLGGNAPFDVDTVEDEAGVAFEVEVCGIVVAADRPRVRGKVRTDDHRRDLLGNVRQVLPNACHVALQPVHGRADKPRSAVRLDLDDEQLGGSAVVHANQPVDGWFVGDSRTLGERGELGSREATKQVAYRIHGGRLQPFLYFDLFHGSVK